MPGVRAGGLLRIAECRKTLKIIRSLPTNRYPCPVTLPREGLGPRDWGRTDGTSNTIAFGEWRTGDNQTTKLTNPQDVIWVSGTPTGATYGSALLNMPLGGNGLNTWLVSCAGSAQGSTSNGNNWSNLGQFWCESLFGDTLGNILVAPNSNYPNCAVHQWGGENDGSWGNYALSSYHSGGANILLGDGSVRFIKNTVNQITLWGLGSRNQNEVIDASAF